MFCFQCQETAKGTGCTVKGVCGKKEDVANLQDLLIAVTKGVALHRLEALRQGLKTSSLDTFVQESLFATITNANFDSEDILKRIRAGLHLKETLREEIKKAGGVLPEQDAATWTALTLDDFEKKSKEVSVLATTHPDIRSLRELLLYGLKGIAAYHTHARHLGFRSESVVGFLSQALASTLDDALGAKELTDLVLSAGAKGVEVMALLDEANTKTFGNPGLSEVSLGVRNNPAILISGHDLKDLSELLIQTEGTGVDVYTHSEMLPAHYYPAFKKYPHLVGNYGNAWWMQNAEFESFNGPIIMTTNCLVPPKDSYKDRVYCTGVTSYPSLKQVPQRETGEKDFSSIIAHAKSLNPPERIEEGTLTGGFAHNQVLLLADKVIAAIKEGHIKHFVVMAGCDGRMKDREYYTRFAKELPKDTIILTAGCAKYRYNKLPLGDIGGIPRVLDAGQCNDSYSLAVIALKLKEALGLEDINELPIRYNIAWYEQKAVIVLLALLSLGIKNIHIGPSLPAFVSENVLQVLKSQFGLGGISSVEEDLTLLFG